MPFIKNGTNARPTKKPINKPNGIPIKESNIACLLISFFICRFVVPKVLSCP